MLEQQNPSEPAMISVSKRNQLVLFPCSEGCAAQQNVKLSENRHGYARVDAAALTFNRITRDA